MPTYMWRCQQCGTVNEVIRPMSKNDVPPEFCSKCVGVEFRRIISVPLKLSTDSSRDPFPINVNGMIFNSRSEQKEYMDQNGLCLYADTKDSSNNGSQESIFDGQEKSICAPSDRAKDLLKEAEYINESEVQQEE